MDDGSAAVIAEPFTLEVAERRIRELEDKFDFYGETKTERELRLHVERLQYDLETANKEIDNLLGEIQLLKESRGDIKSDIVYLDGRIDDVESNCNELDDRMEEAETSIGCLEDDVNDMSGDIDELQTDVSGLQDA